MTHLPNESALKMDGAKACHLYLIIFIQSPYLYVKMCKRAQWSLLNHSLRNSDMAIGADLGVSSKYLE
jgi:hypothetical protein